MPFLFTWNATFEGQPADTENASLGAGRIRDLKSAISERMEIDHSWAGDASDGLHLQATMPQHSSSPTVGADQGAFYVKDSGGTTVPYFKDDAGTTRRLAYIESVYPIGSIYLSVVSTNPGTLFGIGTWVAFGTGRALVGINAANPLMDTVEETFGSADAINVSHTHTITDPGHLHTIGTTQVIDREGTGGGVNWNAGTSNTSTATTGITVDSSGASGTNANYQPSIAIYMWKRTA
jgi:hypothetical protein